MKRVSASATAGKDKETGRTRHGRLARSGVVRNGLTKVNHLWIEKRKRRLNSEQDPRNGVEAELLLTRTVTDVQDKDSGTQEGEKNPPNC